MMLDLCAGLGGQSEAFVRAGWDVLRIDNNPLLSGVERMVVVDLARLHPHPCEGRTVDYVHASPDCTEFSTGWSSPRSRAQREGKEFMPDMTLLLECVRIIEALEPRYWSIENVRGSIRYFEPILGKPRLIVGAYVYWGNFPLFDPSKIELIDKVKKDKRHSPIRANHSAKVDLSLSEAFLHAITSQRRILDY